MIRKFPLLILTLFLLASLLACNAPATDTPTAVVNNSPTAMLPTATHTATATPTLPPTATASPVPPTATPTPTITPTPLPPLNGLTITDILLMDDATLSNIQAIYAHGRDWGRNPNAYSILGDSTVMTPHLLARFDRDDLVLGVYDYLQPTINHFAGNWKRFGVAVNYGLHSWSVFDPMWADKKWCEPEEDLLTCEFRLQNPTFLFIRLGSNDAGSAGGFSYNVRQVIEHTINHGIIPIVITKPDRFEGDNSNNDILRILAADYQIPIWDLDRVAETLPGKGLDTDQVHMVEYPANDFTDPAIFQSGHAMQDLSGLMVLHQLLQTLQTNSQ